MSVGVSQNRRIKVHLFRTQFISGAPSVKIRLTANIHPIEVLSTRIRFLLPRLSYLPIDSVIESVIDSVTYPVLTRTPTPCFHCHPLPSFSFLSYTFSYVYIEVLEPHFNRQSPHSFPMIGARISDRQVFTLQ